MTHFLELMKKKEREGPKSFSYILRTHSLPLYHMHCMPRGGNRADHVGWMDMHAANISGRERERRIVSQYHEMRERKNGCECVIKRGVGCSEREKERKFIQGENAIQ